MGNNLGIKKEIGLIVVAALVFTAAFLWKDFIIDIEEFYFPTHQGLLDRALYTLIMTCIIILIVIYLRRNLGITNNDIASLNMHVFPNEHEMGQNKTN